jgi:hypothetical protein
MKTVGELKEFIKDLPDNMMLLNFQSDMEKNGYVNRLFCSVAYMKKETRQSWDRFDGTPYSYEVFIKSEYGIPCLKFN